MWCLLTSKLPTKVPTNIIMHKKEKSNDGTDSAIIQHNQKEYPCHEHLRQTKPHSRT